MLEGHYKTSRNKYERERERERESHENMQNLNYEYMQNLEIIFGTLHLAK